MRKWTQFILIALFLLLSSNTFIVNAESAKKNVILFYDVQNEIILAQKKNGDFVKGNEEFAKTLKEHYSKRFNIIDIKPAIEENGTLNFQQMLNVPPNAIPVIVQIRLSGSDIGTATYSNNYGATRMASVPSVKMSYKELFGDKSNNVFRMVDYGIKQYDAATGYTRLMGIYIKDNDRTLVKNGVKSYIYTVCLFNPPSRYTNPQAYNLYVGIWTGDNNTLASLPIVNVHNSSN
ncbi:MAG: hypothetical protein E7199_00965 [Schwartzia succinivorans]|nr:hypothetical protein [Schwartzia succinivorans]